MRKNDLYPARVQMVNGVRWGYINRHGQFILPPRFTEAGDFQENGLAVVQVRVRAGGRVGMQAGTQAGTQARTQARTQAGMQARTQAGSPGETRAGVIDSRGRFVVPPKYLSISLFSEGRAVAMDARGAWVIDEKGRVLTGRAYNFVGTFQDGRAVAAVLDPQGNSVYGYLDRQGREVIPLQYQSAEDFVGGKAVVQPKLNEFALIDREGRILARYPYTFVGNLSEGLLTFRPSSDLDAKFGYLNEQGRMVLPPVYSTAGPFQECRAAVNTAENFTENHFGLIDRRGRFFISPEYYDILFLGDGRVAPGKPVDPSRSYLGAVYAVADLNGRFLTGFIFSWVNPYQDGLASVVSGDQTFFIDKNGKMAADRPVLEGNGTLTLVGDLVKAEVDFRLAYYTLNGRLIWRQNTVIPLNRQFRVREGKYKPNKDYLVYYPQIEGMTDLQAQQSVNGRLAQLSGVVPVGSGQLDYNFFGTFSIEFYRKQLLVLDLSSYRMAFGAAHGMPSEIYPHVDLVSGRFYQLPDLFKPGSNYVQVLSDIIARQIQTNPEYSYVFPDSFKGIRPDQYFYVSADSLFIYFFPYEIAPYAAGFPTFRIPFAEIIGLINTEGEFWRAFH